tara:strand:- start:4046 stop:5080 length:1035 start_codon:yes stop_codon:yes gene_type:complete
MTLQKMTNTSSPKDSWYTGKTKFLVHRDNDGSDCENTYFFCHIAGMPSDENEWEKTNDEKEILRNPICSSLGGCNYEVYVNGSWKKLKAIERKKIENHNIYIKTAYDGKKCFPYSTTCRSSLPPVFLDEIPYKVTDKNMSEEDKDLEKFNFRVYGAFFGGIISMEITSVNIDDETDNYCSFILNHSNLEIIEEIKTHLHRYNEGRKKDNKKQCEFETTQIQGGYSLEINNFSVLSYCFGFAIGQLCIHHICRLPKWQIQEFWKGFISNKMISEYYLSPEIFMYDWTEAIQNYAKILGKENELYVEPVNDGEYIVHKVDKSCEADKVEITETIKPYTGYVYKIIV